MANIVSLKREALEGCKFLGHKMGSFELLENNINRISAVSRCQNCDKEVVVDTRPRPNGIEIGGEAVALTCK